MENNNATLLEQWRNFAYKYDTNTKQGQTFWMSYFNMEKSVYEKILGEPETIVKGTVEELALKFGLELKYFVGFLDGINDSLVTPNPIFEMDKDTVVSLEYDKEKLYKNMVAARAEWLFNLEQWDNLIPEDRRKILFKEQRSSTTVVKGKKVGRNEPCPCGSGRKYKQCCGK